MKDTPKPTPEFNRLIGEADNLMSIISLEIQRRLNYIDPISEDIKTFERLPEIKNNTHANLKFTSGNPKLKSKFKKTLEGKQIFFGGYEKEKAEEIFDKYNEIVEKRNKIFHSFPHSVNGKYVKKYRDLSKGEDIIIDENFLRDFIQQCKEFIDTLSNPNFNSVSKEFAIEINKYLDNIHSTVSNVHLAVSKFNSALNMALNISNSVKTDNSTKKISEEPTSPQHR